MTPEQISELERLDKEASGEPWAVGSGHAILQLFDSEILGEIDFASDAALIAAMRNALPRLLLERKELLAALEKLAAQHCDEPGCAHRACAMSAYAAAAYHNAFAEEKG